MAEVRVGFIGAGGIAGRHVGVLLQFEDVKIVAFADPAEERAGGLAGWAGAAAYTDYRQMLDCEKLDALYICVPPFAHGEPELAAAERDLPFFVEKPLATDRDTAARIAASVEQKGLITAVGYHWRYLSTIDQAQELLESNPARLALGYWLDQTPPPYWWQKEELSGGQMVEQTTHIFDMARVLVGEIEEVYGVGSRKDRQGFPDLDVCDVSAATLKFSTGAVGTMSSTCLLNWPHRVGLHLFSEGMAIELSDRDIMIDVGQGRPVHYQQGDPVVREDRDFIDAVQGKTNKVRCPYSEALKTHCVTTAAARSLVEGRPLRPFER
ncbi:MAG TPA: Gfo/Idh/MocA family oxidoreductase [Chloroflexia bacterium]|nr:Gfo/Idh/MocA family oxidoreductase [Chloroflexia bacterium]